MQGQPTPKMSTTIFLISRAPLRPPHAFLSLRYIILAGLFPIILDADHFLQFLDIEMTMRMAHSLPFALIAIVVMMLLFGKKDLRLIAVSAAAVFCHISFDIILNGSTEFPFLAPFLSFSSQA